MNGKLADVIWFLHPSADAFSQEVSTVAELDALLDQLALSFPADAPVLVDVVRANGDGLAIGIGQPILYAEDDDYEETDEDRNLTVLSFVDAGNNPPYYNSLASQPFPGDIAFFYHGQDSEFSGDSAIPLHEAREAIRRFVTGDGLPDNVQWQEV
jgi:hypothetical protein